MKIAKNVNKLGTELVYDIFAKTKKQRTVIKELTIPNQLITTSK